jgi:hypothetical protein
VQKLYERLRYAVANEFAGFAGYEQPEKRLVVAIEAYIDESGSEKNDAIFVLAGFFGEAGQWIEFSDDWRKCLSELPALSSLHMVDAPRLSGDFTNWKREARNAKLRSLAEVIKSHTVSPNGLRAIYFTTPFDVFKEHVVRDLEKPLSAVYLWGLFLILVAIQKDLDERGVSGPFDPIFDRNDVFGRKARVLYPLIRDSVNDKLKISLPYDAAFKDDQSFPPLQAADMLAYLLRRSWNSKSHAYNEDFDWMLTELWPHINHSPQSLMLCAHNIDLLVKLKGWNDSLPIPEEAIRKWQDEVGISAIDAMFKRKQK